MYGRDLSFIHHAGFGDFARGGAPGLLGRLLAEGVRRGAGVVELGCGAGAATNLLIRAGYDVLGVDASAEMIRLARKNAPKARFVMGRLPNVRLPPCDAVVAVGEVLNYMPHRADFGALFRRVFAVLRPGGVFIFDARQPGLIGGPVVRGRAGKNWAVLATSKEDARGRLIREIVSFRRVGSSYRRSGEIHRLTLLSARDLTRGLIAAGFTVRAARAYGSFRLPPGHILLEARRR